MKIEYVKGDATQPVGDGTKFIIHICNDIGAWGAGFVLALSKKWPETKEWYYKWCDGEWDRVEFKLGQTQTVKVEEGVYVVNMIAQRSIGHQSIQISSLDTVTIPPIRYECLKECLIRVAQSAIIHKASVHCPRIGTGLAMGDWSKIESLLLECLCSRNISVTVYDLD